MQSQNQVAFNIIADSPVVRFCLGESCQDDNKPLLNSPSMESNMGESELVHQLIPKIIISEPSPFQSLDSDEPATTMVESPNTETASTNHPRVSEIALTDNNSNDLNKNSNSFDEQDEQSLKMADNSQSETDIKAPERKLSHAEERRKKWQSKHFSKDWETEGHNSKKLKSKLTRKSSLPSKLVGPPKRTSQDSEVGHSSPRVVEDTKLRQKNRYVLLCLDHTVDFNELNYIDMLLAIFYIQVVLVEVIGAYFADQFNFMVPTSRTFTPNNTD